MWRREESLSDLDMSTLHWAPSADGGSGKPGALASSSFTSRLQRHLTVMSVRCSSQLFCLDEEALTLLFSRRIGSSDARSFARLGLRPTTSNSSSSARRGFAQSSRSTTRRGVTLHGAYICLPLERSG